MENKKLICMFAAIFSIVFSIFYYLLFTTVLPSGNTITDAKRTLYMNQLGLYKEAKTIKETQKTLEKEKIESFTMKQGDATAVVCYVSTDEKVTKAGQATLKKLKLSYIQKKIAVENSTIAKQIDQKDYAAALKGLEK